MLKSSPHFVGLVICIGSYKDRESLSDNMFVIAIALLQLANLQNSENQSKVENMDLSELTPFQEEDEKEKRELEE